ncbi:MAG TPA: hypothetical protein VHL98_15470 [Microvirga sp.]|nr:hypothetical protein [Microvirga sp.]
MAGRPTKRGDIIAVLNGLVREGAIASFETDLFDKFNEGAAPCVSVTVREPEDPEPALQRVREALAPLGVDVTVYLSTWQSGGR